MSHRVGGAAAIAAMCRAKRTPLSTEQGMGEFKHVHWPAEFARWHDYMVLPLRLPEFTAFVACAECLPCGGEAVEG